MKIICIGRNYVNHAKELNNPVPSKPLIFMKPPTALLINDKPFYYPDFSKDIHFECELVFKICRNGRHIQPKFALEYIGKIGLGIDFTARDVQAELKQKGHPWEIAKGFDHSAVVSKMQPVEDYKLENIEFEMFKNGECVQHGHSKDMIFSIQELIVYISKYFKLQLGDLIFTGTPAGVGPVKIGDHLEGFIHSKTARRKAFECKIM